MAKWIKNTPIPPVKRGEVAPPTIYRKLYGPLGAIVVTFADLEAQLTRTMNTLLGTSYREGAAIEWLMQNFNNRIELFYFLAMQTTRAAPVKPNPRQTDTAKAEAIKRLRSSAEAIHGQLIQANSDRNNLLHGAWTGLSPTDLTYSKDRLQAAGGTLKEIPVRGIAPELLKDEADYIISVNMRLVDWTARVRRMDRPDLWPAPLPDRYLLHSPLASLLKHQKAKAQQRPPSPSKA